MSEVPPNVVVNIQNDYHNHIDIEEIKSQLRHLEKISFIILKSLREEDAAEAAIVAENEDLRKQLADILSGNVLPPEVQTRVNEVFAKITANNERLKKLAEDNAQPK